MSSAYSGAASVAIKCEAARVWDALVSPERIRQYLFGTEATSEWKVGSPITYRGIWKGKPYVDKGTIMKLVPNRLLQTTYWSGLSGQEDRPENYLLVTYSLSENDGQTTLTVTVDNNPTEEAADHAAGNWASVLQTLKGLLEK